MSDDKTNEKTTQLQWWLFMLPYTRWTFYTNIPSKIVIAQNDDDEKRCKRPEKRKIFIHLFAFFPSSHYSAHLLLFFFLFPFEPRHKRHKQAAERKKKIPLELFQLAAYEANEICSFK